MKPGILNFKSVLIFLIGLVIVGASDPELWNIIRIVLILLIALAIIALVIRDVIESSKRRAKLAELKRMQEAAELEHKAAELEHKAAELRRIAHRDADSHDRPYVYQCVGHPNQTLAIRYGIANYQRASQEGPFGAEIALRKVEKVAVDEDGSHYIAELPDFGNRRVRVVIQPGTEYVKTFYPMSQTWFQEFGWLEDILKDNPTFDLKELATFHVQAALNGAKAKLSSHSTRHSRPDAGRQSEPLDDDR